MKSVVCAFALLIFLLPAQRKISAQEESVGPIIGTSKDAPVGVGNVDADESAHHDHGHGHDDLITRARSIDDIGDLNVTGLDTAPADVKGLLQPGTIIHFWASWCGPCEEEFPQLEHFFRNRISKDLGSRGISLITISNDQAAAAAVRFVEKHNITFPVFLDADQDSNRVIVGKRVLPSTVIVDADGRFHRLALGKLDWNFPGLPDILAAIAAIKADRGFSTGSLERDLSNEED